MLLANHPGAPPSVAQWAGNMRTVHIRVSQRHALYPWYGYPGLWVGVHHLQCSQPYLAPGLDMGALRHGQYGRAWKLGMATV